MASELEEILGAAESALGVPYVWGGNSLAKGVDCSGLVQQAFMAAGYSLPRTAATLGKVGKLVEGDYQPGDLIFWETGRKRPDGSDNPGYDHVAIYIGNGMILEAYKTGEPVRVTRIENGKRRPPSSVRRVIGAVTPHRNVVRMPALGPNQNRTYTQAALSGAGADPTFVPPAPTALGDGDAGFTPGGSLGADLPPDATPEQIEEYIRQHYSDVAMFLANPEIRDLAFKAAREDWGGTKLTHEFRQTEYYKTHGPYSRAFDALIGEDGGAAGALVDTAKVVLGNEMSKLGVTMDDAQLGSAAKQALRNGWIALETGQIANPQMIRQFGLFVLGNQTAGGGLPPGTVAAQADSLTAKARQFLVPINRADAEAWATKIASGAATEEVFLSWVQTLAKARFAGQDDLTAAIDQGVTPGDFFRSHVATVAQRLNVAPETIDLTNPQWSWLTEVVDDKGKRRTPTLTEIDSMARQRPEYEDTDEYLESTTSVGMGLWRFITGQAA